VTDSKNERKRECCKGGGWIGENKRALGVGAGTLSEPFSKQKNVRNKVGKGTKRQESRRTQATESDKRVLGLSSVTSVKKNLI